MRILIISTDYPDFLSSLYISHTLAAASFEVQSKARLDSLFGFGDYYSRNFRAHGADAAEMRVNNPWLQAAWCREHGINMPVPPIVPPLDQRSTRRRAAGLRKLLRPILGPLIRRMNGISESEMAVLASQVEHFRPDVILNQEPAYVRASQLRQFRSPGRLLVGQIASALPPGENFRGYDLVISSLPNFVEKFRNWGVDAELNKLGFEPTILDALGPQPERDIPLSFVGNLSADHAGRIELLEHVARNAPLKVWGMGIEKLPASSPLHACFQGKAWGRGMYEVLRRSQITLNYHIDLSENWANNMRLYEATGAGAMLLTDSKTNLPDIFEPGREVMTYRDKVDCVEKIQTLLADPAKVSDIGAAGQRRVITNHSYFNRTGEMLKLFETRMTAR